MIFTEDTLDEFVRTSDALGGAGAPACSAYWAGFSYVPTYQVDQSLDPYSEAYINEQLALHRELSGREFNQEENELCPFDMKTHARAINPYDHPDPSILAMHLGRLTRALAMSGSRKNARMLDMGCGWGLSSEMGAYLGFKVTAVDISPNFVDLVNARAKRSGWPIHAVQSTFETYKPEPEAELILFYECLHHAVRVWDVIATMAHALSAPRGKLLLVGEPITDEWWINWGLRLDPLSVYCMRKFGWFESGWSRPFLEDCFRRVRLAIHLESDEHGSTVVGQRIPVADYTAPQYLAATRSEGLVLEGDAVLLSGKGSLDIAFPASSTRAYINYICYRPKGLDVSVSSGGKELWSHRALPGLNHLPVERVSDLMRLDLESETWVPQKDVKNGDTRTIGVHIQSVSFF